MHNSNENNCLSISEGNHGLNILVVEDNPVNQKLLSLMLDDFGYNLCITENGLEGVKAYQAQHFDLILMDIQMPIMDGFTATAEIRALEKISGRHVPIIAVTAHSLPGYKEKCLQAGMDNYLAKPYHIDELHNIITETLDTLS
ncbi:MAG: response regulator [Desulfobulbaceae bacterium]|nr:response regulator [Desulfobulbaceae bacterium]HIJ77807.1 response regulator [Deltaproteobacteria bacterium]